MEREESTDVNLYFLLYAAIINTYAILNKINPTHGIDIKESRRIIILQLISKYMGSRPIPQTIIKHNNTNSNELICHQIVQGSTKKDGECYLCQILKPPNKKKRCTSLYCCIQCKNMFMSIVSHYITLQNN